jgi:hypothetical protein
MHFAELRVIKHEEVKILQLNGSKQIECLCMLQVGREGFSRYYVRAIDQLLTHCAWEFLALEILSTMNLTLMFYLQFLAGFYGIHCRTWCMFVVNV